MVSCKTRGSPAFIFPPGCLCHALQVYGAPCTASSHGIHWLFVQQVPNDDPLTGNGTSLPDGGGMLQGADAELTEEQIAKNKEAEEAFKVQASPFAVACVDNASMQHALQAYDMTYAFTGQLVMLYGVSQSHNGSPNFCSSL